MIINSSLTNNSNFQSFEKFLEVYDGISDGAIFSASAELVVVVVGFSAYAFRRIRNENFFAKLNAGLMGLSGFISSSILPKYGRWSFSLISNFFAARNGVFNSLSALSNINFLNQEFDMSLVPKLNLVASAIFGTLSSYTIFALTEDQYIANTGGILAGNLISYLSAFHVDVDQVLP